MWRRACVLGLVVLGGLAGCGDDQRPPWEPAAWHNGTRLRARGLDAFECAREYLSGGRCDAVLTGGGEAMCEGLWQAFRRVGVLGVARDEGDVAMPEIKQMLGRQLGTRTVVEMQGVEPGRLERAAGHHDRHLTRQARQRRIAGAPGQHDDAVHAARAQRLDAGLFARRVPLAADVQGAVAGGPQVLLEAAQRPTVERAVDGLRDDADAQRAPTRQAFEVLIAGKRVEETIKPARLAAVQIAHINGYKVADYSELRPGGWKPIEFPQTGTNASIENKQSGANDLLPQSDKVTIAYMDYLSQCMNEYHKGEYSGSVKHFGVILKQYPGDVNALFYGSMAHYHAGNYHDALSGFESVLTDVISVFNEETRFYKAKSLKALGMVNDADILFNKIDSENGFYAEKAVVELSQRREN